LDSSRRANPDSSHLPTSAVKHIVAGSNTTTYTRLPTSDPTNPMVVMASLPTAVPTS